MPEPVNDVLYDRMVLHAVRLARLANAQGRLTEAELNDTLFPRLEARIRRVLDSIPQRARPSGLRSTKRLIALSGDITEITRDEFLRVSLAHQARLAQIAIAES